MSIKVADLLFEMWDLPGTEGWCAARGVIT